MVIKGGLRRKATPILGGQGWFPQGGATQAETEGWRSYWRDWPRGKKIEICPLACLTKILLKPLPPPAPRWLWDGAALTQKTWVPNELLTPLLIRRSGPWGGRDTGWASFLRWVVDTTSRLWLAQCPVQWPGPSGLCCMQVGSAVVPPQAPPLGSGATLLLSLLQRNLSLPALSLLGGCKQVSVTRETPILFSVSGKVRRIMCCAKLIHLNSRGPVLSWAPFSLRVNWGSLVPSYLGFCLEEQLCMHYMWLLIYCGVTKAIS